jgi:hypothetical protein
MDSADLADAVAIYQAAGRAALQFLNRAMPHFLGAPIDTTAPSWSTAHGDLHWANLCAPELHILDWGLGTRPDRLRRRRAPHLQPADPPVATQVRTELAHALDTPAGRFAELVAITELLEATTRGDNLELADPLRTRATQLLERAVPLGDSQVATDREQPALEPVEDGFQPMSDGASRSPPSTRPAGTVPGPAIRAETTVQRDQRRLPGLENRRQTTGKRLADHRHPARTARRTHLGGSACWAFQAAAEKVTVTLPTDVADYLSQRAESDAIESVSSYVAETVGRKVHRDRDRARLEKALGGPPPQWATDLVHERMAARQEHAESAE